MLFSFGPRTRFKCSSTSTLLSNVNKFIHTHMVYCKWSNVARKYYCCNMATSGSEKQVIVAGIDDSDFSMYALGWILDHFLAPALNLNFKLVLVYARPSVCSTVGFVGPGMIWIPIMVVLLLDIITIIPLLSSSWCFAGASEVLPVVEADLKRTAAKVTENAKDLCQKKSVWWYHFLFPKFAYFSALSECTSLYACILFNKSLVLVQYPFIIFFSIFSLHMQMNMKHFL